MKLSDGAKLLASYFASSPQEGGERDFDRLADFLAESAEQNNDYVEKVGEVLGAVKNDARGLRAFSVLLDRIPNSPEFEGLLRAVLKEIPVEDADRRVWLLEAVSKHFPPVAYREVEQEAAVRKAYPLVWFNLAAQMSSADQILKILKDMIAERLIDGSGFLARIPYLRRHLQTQALPFFTHALALFKAPDAQKICDKLNRMYGGGFEIREPDPHPNRVNTRDPTVSHRIREPKYQAIIESIRRDRQCAAGAAA